MPKSTLPPTFYFREDRRRRREEAFESYFRSDAFRQKVESVDPAMRPALIDSIKFNLSQIYGNKKNEETFARQREEYIEKRARLLERRSIKKNRQWNQIGRFPEQLDVIKRINYKKLGRELNVSRYHYSPWKGSSLEWFMNGGHTPWWRQPLLWKQPLVSFHGANPIFNFRRRASRANTRPNIAKDDAREMWQRELMNWTIRNHILRLLTRPQFDFDLKSLLNSLFKLFPTTSQYLDRVMLKHGRTLWALKRDTGIKLKCRHNPIDYLPCENQVAALKEAGQENFVRETFSKMARFISQKTHTPYIMLHNNRRPMTRPKRPVVTDLGYTEFGRFWLGEPSRPL